MNPRIDPSLLDSVFSQQRDDSGTLIAIVGFDGSGKTSQVVAVANEIRKRGREVIETRQPTDWYRGQAEVVTFHDAGGSREQARVLSLCAAADRLRHVNDVICPALRRGAVVICDRYVYATFAVFVHRGVDFDFLVTINSGIPRPDYAFYLNVPIQLILDRLRVRDGGDLKFEERRMERIQSIIRCYEEMDDHLIRIDGAQSLADVTSDILKCISSRPLSAPPRQLQHGPRTLRAKT